MQLNLSLMGAGAKLVTPLAPLPTTNLGSVYGFGPDTTLDATADPWGKKLNQLYSSEDWTVTNWSKTNSTLSSDGTADPMGGTASTKWLATATTATRMGQGQTVVAGQVYTLSAYFKIGSGRTALSFRVSGAGVVTDTATNITITADWARYSYTFTPTGSGAITCWVYMQPNGDSGPAASANDYVYIFGANLNPSSSALTYRKSDLDQRIADSQSTLHAWRGVTLASVEATQDPPWLLGTNCFVGLKYAGTQYCISPNRTFALNADFTVYVVARPTGTANSVFSVADSTVTNKYHEVRYNGSGKLLIASRNGAGAETTSSDLTVDATKWVVLEFKQSSGTLTLARMDTGASVTLSAAGATSTPRFGWGYRACSGAAASIADALEIAGTVSYTAAVSAPTAATAYAFIKAKLNDATLRNLGVL